MICPNCNSEISELPCPSCPSDLPEDSYGLPVGLFVGSILSDEIKRNQQKKKKIQTTLAATGIVAIIVVVVIAVFSHFTGRNTPPPVAPVVTITTPERPAPVFTAPEPDEPLPEEIEDVYHPEPVEEDIEPIEEEISIDEIVEFLISQVIEYPVFITEDFALDHPRMILHIAYDDLTDEILIAFLDAFDITYSSWFTFDFGDETGYVFGSGDHTHFGYGVLDEEGALSYRYYQFGFANIRNGVIEWHFRIDVPYFDTVAEYLQWATGNGFELVVLNRYFEPVGDIQSVLHRNIFEHPKPIYDGATEIEIVVDDE